MTEARLLETRVDIASDLRKIVELSFELHGQALASSNDHDFPGGTALHMLGPVSASAAWERAYSRKETLERFDPVTGKDRWEGPISPFTGLPTSNERDPAVYQSEADAAAQPMNVLESWTRMVREDRDQPTGLAPTLSREVDYLRGQLDWICRADTYGEPEWPLCFEMRDELQTLVKRMESVLHSGEQIDRSRVTCTHCDEQPRLVKVWSRLATADVYKCPRCKTTYDRGQFMKAKEANLRARGTDRFVLATQAEDAIQVPKQTMRSWMRRGLVRTACDIKTKRLLVWWPDVREQAEARRVAALTKAAGVSA